jgi:hypothetical protein
MDACAPVARQQNLAEISPTLANVSDRREFESDYLCDSPITGATRTQLKDSLDKYG